MEILSQEDLRKFFNELIEGMRPKLLDLTRRNPLLSTPFSERSYSNLRVVDEVPSFLFEKLLTDKMRLVPLPSLEEDPKDEDNQEFKNAYASARYADEEYQEKIEKLDADDDDLEQKRNNIDRVLKDKVRAELGMPPRQTKVDISLQQHAKNHFINPSYDLESELDEERAEHVDSDIQTLLLPDVFERRTNSILSKVRMWEQETGISVFHVAFGFLEWSDKEGGKKSFAPLILMPATIEKQRKSSGVEFYISCEGESPEHNVVLSEKLKIDFSIELEVFNSESAIDEYYESVEKDLPKHLKWRVRRQVALGVFPSAKMAMYHDLDTEKWNFLDNDALKTLFAGNENHEVSLYADDYDVDEKEIESKVPYLITEADSSQFSAIVDVANAKNLAIEGPPGSGKSQTIVNTIATALYEGKKVLFVAEKTAALEVVKSRLEALNLGEFLLPLLASKGGRSAIIESLRERVDHGGYHLEDIRKLRSSYVRSRNELKKYINILSSQYELTGLNVHQILGARLKVDDFFQELPDEVRNIKIDDIKEFDRERIIDVIKICEELEEASKFFSDKKNNWQITNVSNLTPFAVDEILKKIAECERVYQEKLDYKSKLVELDLAEVTSNKTVVEIIKLIQDYQDNYSAETAKILHKAQENNAELTLESFSKDLKICKSTQQELEKYLKNVDLEENFKNANDLLVIFAKYNMQEASIVKVESLKENYKKSIEEHEHFLEIIKKMVNVEESLAFHSTRKLIELAYILENTSEEVLSFRNKSFEDPSFHKYVENKIKLAESIRKKRKELECSLFLDREYDEKEIQEHLDSLVSSGIFSIFQTGCRNAKKFYKLISRDHKYNKKDAVSHYESLLSLLSDNNKFNKDISSLEGVFAYNFDGVDTDFNICTNTISFYKRINDFFGSDDFIIIRNFVYKSDLYELKKIPGVGKRSIENIPDYSNFEEINSKYIRLREANKTLEKDIELARTIFPFLKNEVITQNALNQVKELIPLYEDKKNSINDENVKCLLGDKFNYIDTSQDFLGGVFALRDKIRGVEPISDVIINCFVNNAEENLKLFLEEVTENHQECFKTIKEYAALIHTNVENILNRIPVEKIPEWAKEAKKDREGLLNYSKYSFYKNEVSKYGFSDAVNYYSNIENGYLNFSEKIRAVIFNNLAEGVYAEHGEGLAKFNGLKLNKLRRELANKDREIQELAGYHIAENLVQNASPPSGNGIGPKRSWTQNSLINNEISKKRQHISPRALTKRAGKALMELKPCWLMSPLSVAQYIDKNDIEFDLLIIDEASQMTPENAIGAIVRCKQVLIVGDTNQLPPTSFFKKFISNEDDDEDSVTEESILEIANNAFRPARRLRWHYRSRHSSLIAFSNKYIYDNDLTIYPSASENNPTMGVSLIKTDGVYSSGTNPKEAAAMVEHIIKFMKEHRDRSLGVVTVNQKQRDLVYEEFEYALTKHPDILDYLSDWDEKNDGLESFFIKNLENVQGDERDVIFIGTVYGPQSEGAKVMQRFGPINGVAGKRRLNVLFTRAKKQIVTFTSMLPSDVLAEESSNPGVYLLKQWLEYSKTGVLESGVATYKEPDSEFEEYVISQIMRIGCEAVPQVGVSGYFVDIGVKHPSWPHGYILGVECDGAAYHSSKSARDRDRLREEVLTNLGWQIYRIWSTDWFENPRAETEKLRLVIKERLQELAASDNIFSNIEPPNSDKHADMSDSENSNKREEEAQNEHSEQRKNYYNEAEAREILCRLRDEEIVEEFEFDDPSRCILNNSMIEMLLINRPKNTTEFRKNIPLAIREKIDPKQMIYLSTILDVIKRVY